MLPPGNKLLVYYVMLKSELDAFTVRWTDVIERRGYEELYGELAATYDEDHAWINEQFGDCLKKHLDQAVCLYRIT